MTVSMKEVQEMMTLFLSSQKKHKVKDRFNVTDAKWTLRDIMIQLDDRDTVTKLIQFYFIMSDTKTWQEFVYKYDEYLEAWEAWKQNYYSRQALLKQTMERHESRSQSA